MKTKKTREQRTNLQHNDNSRDESLEGLLLICNSIGERGADAFAQHQTKEMEHQKEIGRDRVDSIINNDPFRYERPYYRPSSWYLLLLTIQLTAIIVFQFAFASIIISFKLFEFLPLPCLSFLSYLCTIVALARPCRLLLLPHIFIESLVTLIYFTLSALTIRDALRFSSNSRSSVFRDVEVERATKFGIILLCGFPFQFFFVVVVIRRYYIGFV